MTKPKDDKLTSSFLGAEMRIDLIEKLKGWGIDAKDLNDTDLLAKVTSYAADMNKRLIAAEATALDRDLNSYAAANPTITDKEFLVRLFNLNVPKFYLKLFTNADGVKNDQGNWAKTDQMIWSKIRRSRIKPPLREASEILKARYQLKDVYQDGYKNDDEWDDI